jgi:hypothetical protein
LSLAALAACTNDDFQVQNATSVAEETSPVQFEVINNDALTRASMDGNKIAWSAADGDLFTLYHGAAGGAGALTGYENATYTATAADGEPAVLTTPSMIKQGAAIMVWPVDTAFNIEFADNLFISIPFDQSEDIENNIPYLSDQFLIGAYDGVKALPNTAGYDRKYPVYMRPMASQLIVKADYAGTDATLAELEEGEDGIEPIRVKNVGLLCDPLDDPFTYKIGVKFTDPGDGSAGTIKKQWNDAVANNAWVKITDFDLATITSQGFVLNTEALDGNDGCKFLLLPQTPITGGVDDGAVGVNTIYGKVIVASDYDQSSMYTAAEQADAWYRFVTDPTAPGAIIAEETAAAAAETSGPGAGKYKVTSEVKNGMMQTINGLSTYTHKGDGVVKGEPEGAAATRYVKVLLTHLDMSDLHIDNDKWLRDAARVWQKMGLTTVTVYLDGDANQEFAISQKTIETINEINAAAALEDTPRSFSVKPCQLTGEKCNTIVITGGGEIQDLLFIEPNGTFRADVALNAGESWEWNKDENNEYIVYAQTGGVKSIINRGTLESAVTGTYKTYNSYAVGDQNNIPFVNAKGATWNINSGVLNVQFDVTNYGTVNIAKGAQYRQDGQVQNTVFTNEATALPTRFGGNDKKIGKVVNKGVFATVEKAGVYTAKINNYGLIEHADENAKTYITANQLGGNFTAAFSASNKMGRINLPYSNKEEDNVSVSANLLSGFVSVTVDGEVSGALNASVVGSKVNYVIVNSGITSISAVSSQVKYLEINQPGTELAWTVSTPTNYTGLMVLSDVNIKLNTNISATVTYLGADMYVGGVFNVGTTTWNGYYGDTTANVASQYITY